jgi:phytanoyl-CoA hydroxylase
MRESYSASSESRSLLAQRLLHVVVDLQIAYSFQIHAVHTVFMETHMSNATAILQVPGSIKTEAQEYYEQNGYYICRGIIPPEMIDLLLKRYKEDIVPSKYPFFRQSTDAYEPNQLTEHGYVKQSYLDIHDYQKYPEFSRLARDIYTSEHMRNALKDVTGFNSFNLMQTMLFDANTETVPHQDWWYLDSVPYGHLLASWIALEDIDERAGRFFVLPKSHYLNFHSDIPGLEHEAWQKRIADYVAQHPEQVFAPALKKGDVLFWNSRTIHGALPTQDPSFSRKSVTAHYMPSQFQFGNIFGVKDSITYKTYNGMKFYRTQQDYTLLLKLKLGIKESIDSTPSLMRGLRKVKEVFAK